MKKLYSILALLVMSLPMLRAQVVTTEPNPLQESSQNVVIWFHADEGNKGLMGLDGSTPIYAHTGVSVVDGTGNQTDWKYDTNWNTNDPKYAMEYVSENLWKLVIGDIRTFYGVPANETITQLCFVFRNNTGSKKGLEEDGSDIFVPVSDAGFQLSLTKSISQNVFVAPQPVRCTAATTVEADIKIYVNDVLLAENANTKSLQAIVNIETEGNYEVKAVATAEDKTQTRTMLLVYAKNSSPAADTTVPPMGLTKNDDGSYTFCLAAPEKASVMLVGSWDNYTSSNDNVMDYVDATIDGGTFRYFKTTRPASVTGNTFGYYYVVDGTNTVGDPYARLVLDPSNDKYISAEVYPNLPEYPNGKVPSNTVISWHSDNMLDYTWKTTDFVAPAKDNLVIYELLLRDFTGTVGQAKGNGNVKLAMEKLPYLKELGVNAIELLPINEFNGNNSWGYNPNFYFAIDKAYGTPQAYKEFIDKCHELGMAVILDVVFNQSDWLHPWYKMYSKGSNPFFNATAPHAYSVLNDWNQGYPLVKQQWDDMVKFWLSEYNVDGFRFDLVKGLGDNNSYPNANDSGTNAYNASRVANMKRIHDAMREVNPDAYFINENLAGEKEENEMAADGELNWANVNNAGCQFAMGYSSDSSLNRMWALKDKRTVGSTVAYLESHDEQRLGYKQITWGVSAVKEDHTVACQRLGAAAAQMILVPGSHMIWQFSEMGNDQNTKNNDGGNNTSPKIVCWDLLDDPDNAALVDTYKQLITLRLANPELFAEGGNYQLNFSGWTERTASASADGKELYLIVNPSVNKELKTTVNFLQDTPGVYGIAACSQSSWPTIDYAAKEVRLAPNCFVVITTKNVTGVEEIGSEVNSDTRIFADMGNIRILNGEGSAYVYGMDGSVVAKVADTKDAAVAVAAGMYVVKCADKTTKLLVK